MKKLIKTFAYIAVAAAVIGCAKEASVGPNEANVRYFNSWMKINHPGLEPVGLGIYVLEEEKGTGTAVKEDGFVYADYIRTDLEGNISEYTDKHTAKQLGTYDTTYYYGPKVITTTKRTIPAGLFDAIKDMKVGGRKKVIIPSWLMSYYDYKTEQEYIDNTSNGSNTIYDITIREYADSIYKHEISLIEAYQASDPATLNNWQSDTTGFYYRQISEPADTSSFPKDTTVYINYTGRLLSGLIFDTTIEKVAKDNGIYSASRTYGPSEVSWGEKWSDLKLGESSVISGFALTLWQMRAMEKGIGVFYSPLGYSYNGSGKSIPGYAPLIFEIEFVAKPE